MNQKQGAYNGAVDALVIGNKNYSSWSLRPWLVLKQAHIDFQEIRIPLHQETTDSDIRRYSPSGRVPVLRDGDLTVCESLAICEYVAERFPHARLWPQDVRTRAVARSISHEMHAGFQALRKNMPMDCRTRFPGKGMAPGVQEDINRITDIWKGCRERYGKGGAMLFGHFTIADAMFAPVVTRFMTYEVKVDPISKAYMDAVLALPVMQEWIKAACEETEHFSESEAAADFKSKI